MKQGSTNSLSGGAEQLEIALKGEYLLNMTVKDIYNLFRKAFIIIGYKTPYPAETEMDILILFLRKHFPYHTGAEFTLAFELAVVGKLNVEVNHFQDFSIKYVGSILSAYRKWAIPAYQMIVKHTTPQPTVFTEAQIAEAFSEASRAVIDKRLALDVIPLFYYDWLLSAEKVGDYAEYARAAALSIGKELADLKDKTVAGRNTYRAYREMWLNGCFLEPWATRIIEKAKRITIQNFILSQQSNA